MEKLKHILLLGFVSFLLFNCAEDESWKYLGEIPPADIPKVFAPGKISTEHLEHSSPHFTKDLKQVFWSSIKEPLNENYKIIYHMKFENGKWSDPKPASFSGKFNDDSPTIFDGKVYFSSKRNRLNLPDSVKKLHWSLRRTSDIFYSEYKNDSWSEAKLWKNNLTGNYKLMLPVFTNKGNIYFLDHLKNVKQQIGIYYSINNGENYEQPEVLTPSINSIAQDWTQYISPDESYLIFSSTRNTNRKDYGDLYICFKDKNNNWSEPIYMGDKINTTSQERFPYVSPDGKYLFFTRYTEKNSQDVFWVSAGIIDELKQGI